jgi:hypothetical protein
MRILIIDQCSGTKNHPEDHPVVDQEGTRNTDAEGLLQSLGIDGIRAKDLYTGKQQKRITDSVRTLEQKNNEVERVFISAGFGLVDADQRLPPYEATFNTMSKSEIAERSERFRLTEYIDELIDGGSFDIVFFALGSKYYEVLDLDELLASVPTETTIVLFNQEELGDAYDQVVSVPARTEQGKRFGSAVVGLKGTYLKNFAGAIDSAENSITPERAVEYCLTDFVGGSQSGIDNYS